MEERHPEFLNIVLTDVNQRGIFGNTVLHLASYRGNLEEVEALLTAGAEVNAEGETGNRPLHEAASKGHLAVVKRLLEAGAITNVLNDFEQRPQDLALLLDHHDVVAAIVAWNESRKAVKGN
jgi:ankyrin repeat protein